MLARVWSNRNSHPLVVGIKNGTAIFEDILLISTKLNILIPYKPAIMLLGIYAKEFTIYVHIKTRHKCLLQLYN